MSDSRNINRDHPDCIALTTEINAQFGSWQMSAQAIGGYPKDQAVALTLVHRYVSSDLVGQRDNATRDYCPQLYFTPEDAIKAMRVRWLRYFLFIRDIDGSKPYEMAWHTFPGVEQLNDGSFFAHMRCTPVWLDRDNMLYAWDRNTFGTSISVADPMTLVNRRLDALDEKLPAIQKYVARIYDEVSRSFWHKLWRRK